MSFGSGGQHRQGLVPLHPHHQQQPAGVPAAVAAAVRGGAKASPLAMAGLSITAHRGSAAAEHQQLPLLLPLHKHLSGHKHRRESAAAAAASAAAAAAVAAAAAADKSAGGGRNGSDSGSNSPGDQTPAPDSRQDQEEAQAERLLSPPSKHQRTWKQ